jgi:hypothetical protein
MSDHLTAWAGSGISFRAHTPEQRQRLADGKAERCKVWRFRVRDDGTIERKQFASRSQVPLIEGWAASEKAARRIAARLLPQPRPAELPAVIPLPAPARYKLDRPRCGAKTRKGTPCQAAGIGRGGRCKFHGGMSTGPRTSEGRARTRDGYFRWLARVRASRAHVAAAAGTTQEPENRLLSAIKVEAK